MTSYSVIFEPTIGSSPLLVLHLSHLLSDVISVVEADHKDDGDFHEEVDHREENHSVV